MIPGKIGRYEIRSEIGRGGMATVYHAFDPRFQREVAVKVMPHALLHDPSFRIRFEREARAIAALEGPTIVPVYDYGEENGLPYLVMRYMPGGSLEDRLKKGIIPLAEVARIFTRLAPAIDSAHLRGVVHRDLKPANILFDAHGEPYLSDFGIVKLAEGTSTTLTGSAIIGTPAYMSPEQGRGDADIDGRSDVYSLGSILFQTLSGKLPYEAATPTGLIIKHITEPIPDLLALQPNLPVSCQFIIERGMAKNREQRFRTAGELAQALTMVTAGAGRMGLQPSPLDSTPLPAAVPAPLLQGDEQQTLAASPLPGSTEPIEKVEPALVETQLEVVPPDLAVQDETARQKPLSSRPTRKTILGGVVAIVLALIFLMVFGFGMGAAILVVLPRTQTLLPAATTPVASSSILSTSTAQDAEFLPSPNLPFPSATATLQSSSTTATLPRAVVNVVSAILRAGPGVTYQEIAVYSTGEQLETVGRSQDGQWLALSDSVVFLGWISLADVKLAGDIDALPVILAPPTPTATVTSTAPPLPPSPSATRAPQKKSKSPTPAPIITELLLPTVTQIP